MLTVFFLIQFNTTIFSYWNLFCFLDMVLGNVNGRSLVSRDQFGLDYLGALLIRKFINYAAAIV